MMVRLTIWQNKGKAMVILSCDTSKLPSLILSNGCIPTGYLLAYTATAVFQFVILSFQQLLTNKLFCKIIDILDKKQALLQIK